MVALIAKSGFLYGGRSLKAGDEFTARDIDGRALVGIRRAVYATAAPNAAAKPKGHGKGKRTYQRRDVQPAETVVMQPEPVAVEPDLPGEPVDPIIEPDAVDDSWA